MIKKLVKISNKLDTMGLTREADLLDDIIYKIAMNIINPSTKSPVKMDEQLSKFLEPYVSGGSLRVPDKFSTWLLSGGAGTKNVYSFFNVNINPIWKDYGFQYIKTLPKFGASIDFYLKLAQLVPGWDQEESDPTEQYDIKIIYKNLYDYSRGREDLMRSSKSYSTVEQVAHGVGGVVTSPYTAYQALQNPSVRKETKDILNTYSNFEENGTLSQNATALILGAPLTFANALVDFQTGQYKSGILNFTDAIITTLVQFFGGKALTSLIKDPVKRFLYDIVLSLMTGAATSKAKQEILKSNMPENKKKEAIAKVEENNLRPIIETRINEQIGKIKEKS